LTLALAPGLLVGAGAKIIGSKSVDQSAFAENTETVGNPAQTEKKTSKIAARTGYKTDNKSDLRRRRRRRRRSSIRTTARERIRKTLASKTKAD